MKWGYCTEAVFCLEFCGKSRQKQPPYNKIDMELCPKDLYSLFESRLLHNLDPNSEYSSFAQRSISLTETVFATLHSHRSLHHGCRHCVSTEITTALTSASHQFQVSGSDWEAICVAGKQNKQKGLLFGLCMIRPCCGHCATVVAICAAAELCCCCCCCWVTFWCRGFRCCCCIRDVTRSDCLLCCLIKMN